MRDEPKKAPNQELKNSWEWVLENMSAPNGDPDFEASTEDGDASSELGSESSFASDDSAAPSDSSLPEYLCFQVLRRENRELRLARRAIQAEAEEVRRIGEIFLQDPRIRAREDDGEIDQQRRLRPRSESPSSTASIPEEYRGNQGLLNIAQALGANGVAFEDSSILEL